MTSTLYYFHQHGGVAQLGEHLPCKQGVRSSNLLISTMAFQKKSQNQIKLNNHNQMKTKRHFKEKNTVN